jgi:hypothetical protein
MNKVVDNQEMLQLIREDRPHQTIHEVLDFRLNQYGFYDVRVDMQHDGGLNTIFEMPTVIHVVQKLPYPTSEYMKLTDKQQLDWRFE